MRSILYLGNTNPTKKACMTLTCTYDNQERYVEIVCDGDEYDVNDLYDLAAANLKTLI